MRETADIIGASRRAWLSAGAPIVVLVVIVALAALATFVNFAEQENHAFRQNSMRLVANALDFANWNDAYRNISVRWDRAWVVRNYYSAVADGLVVFRRDGALRHAWMNPALDDESHRLTMGLARTAQAVPHLEGLERAPTAAGTVTFALTAIDGKLALISVAAIAPEDNAVRLALPAGGNGDFVATVKFIDTRTLTDLGRLLGLSGLRFESSDAEVDARTLRLPLRDAAGAVIGEARWTDQRPGDAAFAAQMPPLVLSLLLVGGLTVLVAHALARRQVAAAAHAKAAQESSRLKSDFISTMSHELRTPLDAIIGYAELIEEEGENDPGYAFARQDAGRIVAAARQLRQLVDDTLDQTRIDAGHLKLKPARLVVRDLLSEVEDILAPLARANGDALSIPPAHGAMHLYGDHQRVRQCLLNLAGNAIKFTQNGVVTVRARHALRSGAPFVTFDVADTGIGITPEQAKRLFEPFGQGDDIHRAYGGVGLGLAIARKLARAMGGDIEFVSEVGKGSCFSLHLPVGRGVRLREAA